MSRLLYFIFIYMKIPFRISDINIDNILYSNPVINDDKTNILLKYNKDNKKHQFLIQTPELVCLSKPILKNDIYEINVTLQAKSSKKMKGLLDFFKLIDDKMQKLGQNNDDWFNNKKRVYRKIIRDDNNHPNGILKLKVKKENIPKYLKVTKNKQSEPANINDINAGYKIKLVIDIFGLWIRKNNDIYYYGLYLKPVLIDYKVIEEIAFIEDSESDNDNDNDILDTEYEQHYDNTETSVMNLQNIKTNVFDMKMSDIEDSICNPLELTIENINIDKNLQNISDSESDMPNISDSDMQNHSESDIKLSENSTENKFIAQSDDNTTAMMANYDNNNSDSSSIGNTNTFNLTTEINNN